MKKIRVLLFISALILSLTACDSTDYKEATQLFNAGKFAEAEVRFLELGDYQDSAQMVKKCQYQQALELHEDEEYKDAAELFELLADYEDSIERAFECKHLLSKELMKEEKYGKALPILEELDKANALENGLNTLAWCKVAVYLETNKVFTSVQDKGMEKQSVNITFDERGKGIQFSLTWSTTLLASQKYDMTLTLEQDDPMADIYLNSDLRLGISSIEETASAVFDIRAYHLGDDIALDDHTYNGTDYYGKTITNPHYGFVENGALVADWMNGIAIAISEMDLGITIQDLGFVNLETT